MDTLNARLDELMHMMAVQKNPSPAQPNPASAPTSNPMVLAKPQPIERTRGAAAEEFVLQIGLHAVTYPECFPTHASKVVFAVLFMKDHTATWSQPYLDKVFNREPVVFNELLNNFRSSFFDHNRQHHARVALQNLRQNGTMSTYTQAHTMGWANTPLMSRYHCRGNEQH
ncbi:uncharacterized protein VP01_10782g1 [Puccinia sorghi]|uniref:Retrotransposon gag domain-containing protein n=1 Tax=Puccinia sorghi TaxID=27349 RepID=A0A0L6VTP7_9BASI|nr:uncharacterized protein VP01_10782g1 [Puccinia sorghi]